MANLDSGAKNAENSPSICVRENAGRISSCFMSSMSRSDQEFSVTRHAPLKTAAAANHVKSCEIIQMNSGTDQDSVSKRNVVLRRPSLSVITPESVAKTTCATMLIEAT